MLRKASQRKKKKWPRFSQVDGYGNRHKRHDGLVSGSTVVYAKAQDKQRL